MRDDGDLKYSESEGGGVNLRHERTGGTKQTNKNYRTRDKTLLEQSLSLHHTVTSSLQWYSFKVVTFIMAGKANAIFIS